MGLLSTLNLPQPKSLPPVDDAKAPAAPPSAVRRPVLALAGGEAWEEEAPSKEKGSDAQEQRSPAVSVPSAGKDAAPPPMPNNIVVPVSLSIPIGRKLPPYLTIEKIKIEGELKLSPVGDAGAAQASARVEVPLDKKKAVRGVKFEVDLNKLKELVFGDLQKSSQNGWKVDPKLECKVSTEEVNVALGITVANDWYTGSTKFVALAKSKGKDTQFANFDVSPIGYQFPKKPIELGGMKAMVSGKLTVTVVLQPDWGKIAADVASKIGRPVLTALAEAATIETAIVAGFAAIAAAQIFVFVKSAGEITDIKVCAKAAENGWLSFRSGYGSVYGISWNDGGAAQLRKSGVACASQFLMARVKAAREREQQERGEVPAKFDEDYVASFKEVVAKDPNQLDKFVHKNFERRILEGFLKAYEGEHRDDYQFESNYRALRTRVLGEM